VCFGLSHAAAAAVHTVAEEQTAVVEVHTVEVEVHTAVVVPHTEEHLVQWASAEASVAAAECYTNREI
jgi:hypothetical protein